MIAQSPRFAVTAQTSVTRPALSSAICFGRRLQKALGGFARFARQHHQELAAAARTQQNPRQTEFGQQGARQHLAEQGDPLRLAGQQVFTGGTHRTSFGGTRQKELLCAQNFTLQQDLFGHRTLEKPLRTPHFSTEF